MGSILGNVLGAGTGGVFGLASGIFNAKAQSRENRRNREFAREQSELAYQRELEMWNKQNEYNSPTSQMQRFSSAGLNPNLIYGQGNAGNATVLPKYNAAKYQGVAPKIDLSTMANLLTQYNNLRLGDAQVNNVKADTETKAANKNFILANTLLTGAKHSYQMKYNSVFKKKLDAEIKNLLLSNKLKDATMSTNIDLMRNQLDESSWRKHFRDRYGVDSHSDAATGIKMFDTIILQPLLKKFGKKNQKSFAYPIKSYLGL